MWYNQASQERGVPMNLKQTRYKDGRVWLSIVKKYRKDGISKTRTVEKIGWLDELKEEYGDPVAHFKAYAKGLTEREQAENAVRFITFHPLKKIDKRTQNRPEKYTSGMLCRDKAHQGGDKQIVPDR